MMLKRLGAQSLIVNYKKHEIYSLLGFYTVYNDGFLTTFRDNLPLQSSRVDPCR